MAQNSCCTVAEEVTHTQKCVIKKLNARQQALFDAVANVDYFPPIFVSGSAGTGKSALLVALRNYWQREQDKNVCVTAFTHLAARNIEGKTCHSVFGFDFKMNLDNRPITLPDYLIIDEISMLPSKMLDDIDLVLRKNSKNYHTPFGGVNVIVFGDLYQLQPVGARPPYEADVWSVFSLYELTENMRQSESEYMQNLNLIRVGNIKGLDYFDKLVMKPYPTIKDSIAYTSLVSTHKECDNINEKCYKFLKGTKDDEVMWCKLESVKRTHQHTTVFNAGQKTIIFKPIIRLFPGARVMITHTTDWFCNGDAGIVERIESPRVYIRREYDDQVRPLDPITLHFSSQLKDYVESVTGLPLSYGWAATIHKAQGITVKNLIVYPDCIFAPGQAYVAISRTTHSEGLRLTNKIPISRVHDMSFITKVYEEMENYEI
ncbi:DNA-helicase-2 [Diatraea saccharalis granulovirus]|uniref:DNA-helicase-2 n=1 Tax=Diatraea saccharalis granulovirus TaxID=1675862 RepID=A0A0R7EZ11_9BBAC|nr:DNA-helicase-2 [Diatraea saccharalis granulovirus]AKN80759.1 DNA-helicase-2 [Diatraea saccharalis granulovirus]